MEMTRTYMRRTASLVIAFTAILGLVLPASAGDEVPFKGQADEVITGTEQAPDGLHITVFATGQATHLGSFTRNANVVVHPDAEVVGTLVWTAANGDQLFADLVAAFISPTAAAGTYTFTGGTGRFENATGEADFETVTSDGIHFDLTFEGTISSPGQNP
jgi:hypothetical protein